MPTFWGIIDYFRNSQDFFSIIIRRDRLILLLHTFLQWRQLLQGLLKVDLSNHVDINIIGGIHNRMNLRVRLLMNSYTSHFSFIKPRCKGCCAIEHIHWIHSISPSDHKCSLTLMNLLVTHHLQFLLFVKQSCIISCCLKDQLDIELRRGITADLQI
jgi:hypothetical protein